MKLFRALYSKLSLIFLALSFSNAGYAEKGSEKDWKQYLPVTGQTIQADIMEIQSPEEFEKLAAKLQGGLKKNPAWALEFVGSIPKGQPLPYHENLGLTKQEHAQMLELTQKQGTLNLKKSGTIDITFEPLTDGRIKILTNENSALNNLIISAKEVETRFGNLIDVSDINNQDPKAITGPWKGVKWGKNTVDQKTMVGESIQFCIGKRDDNKDQGIIYYDGKILQGYTTPPTQFTQVLFFPLAK